MKKVLSLFLMVMIMLPLVTNAQTTATFGTGTNATGTGGSAGSPMSAGTLFSYTQNIYTAAELTAAGVPAGATITAIAFQNATGAATMHGCHTYMGYKSTTSFSSTSDIVPYGQLQQVDSSDWVTTGTGWFTINLTTPFTWNGSGNLVVGVAFSGASSGAANCGYNYTAQSENRQFRRYLSHTNAGAEYAAIPSYTGSSTPSGTSFSQSVSTSRPNLQITYIVSSCPSFTPTTVHIGAYTADLSWTNYNQSQYSWDLLYGETGTFDTISGGTMVTSISDTFYTISGLTPVTSYQVYLKAHCSSEDGSWSFPRTFTTDVPCPVPANVRATDVSDNSATLAWTPGDAESNWDIYEPIGTEVPDGNTVATYTTTIPEYTISYLNSNTNYTYYVRANCGVGDVSLWVPVQFTTLQVAATLPYTQDFEDATENSEWFLQTSGTNTWHIGTATNNTTQGTTSMYISNDNGTSNSYTIGTSTNTWAYRDIDFDHYAEYEVSFDYRSYGESCCDYIKVFVGQPAEPSGNTAPAGATQLGGNMNMMSDWTHVSYTLNSSFSGVQRLYFLWHNDSSVGTDPAGAIDNITVSGTNCGGAYGLTASNITENSIEFNFHPALATDFSWQTLIVGPGETFDENMAISIYDTTYEFTGLNGDSPYSIYVRTDCGGEYSAWAPALTVRTDCPAEMDIPFAESFDTYGTGSSTYYPSCWTRLTNYSTQYPYISSTHYDGVGSLYFYASSTYYSLATTNAFDLSAYDANSLMLSFKAYSSSTSYGRLDVGVMTDPTNLNTMTVLKSIYPGDYAATSTWQDFNVILSSTYTYGDVYIAFLAPAGATNYVYVDAVTLDYAPTCMDPTHLVIGHVAGASAEIRWTEPTIIPDGYTIEYSEAGQGNWILADSYVQGNSYIITGLTPQTAYDVRVTSECSDGTPTPIVGNFTTGCLAGGDITIGNGTTTSNSLPLNNYYNYSYTQQIFLSSEIGGANDFSSVSFEYAYSSASTSKNNCVIYLGQTTQSTFSSSSDYISVSNLQQVYSGPINCHQGWNTFTFTTPFHYDGTSNLVLVVDDNSGNYDGSSYTFNTHTASGTRSLYFYSDSYNPDPSNPTLSSASSSTSTTRSNVKFGGECDNTVTCIAPTAHITDVDDESITISWGAGYTESSWELEYKAANESTWTPEGTISTSPYTIVNLLANTNYSVRLRSDCGGEYSSWVMLDAQTECATIETLPYTQNFETATGSGSGHFIDCWRRGTSSSTAYPYTSTSYHHSGNYSLYFYGTSSTYSYAASPRFSDDIDMSNLQISFYAYKTSAAYNIEVGIMTDPTDYSTFQPIGTFSPSTTSTWELAEINTNTYTGNGHYVAFREPAYITSNIYLDDIDIHEIPFCGRVTNIAASQITTTSATISWVPGSSETGWEVLYGPTGTVDFDNGTPIYVTDNTLDVNDLQANTAYEVYVRIDCGGGEYGAWTLGTFRSACGMIDALPYIENFDSYGTGTSVYPDCWGKINTYSSDRPYINTTNYSAPGSLYFYAGNAGTYNIAITPMFDASIPINTLKAKFMYRTTNSTDQLVVGVMTNPSDASTFVPVSTVTATSTGTWYQKEVSFANYTGTGQYIAFKNAYTSTYGYAYVDNLIIDALPACSAPTNLTFSNITSNSADIQWTDAASESSWEINICPTGQSPIAANTVAVSTNSYSFYNLSPGLTYDVYVRTECSSGDGYSDNLMGSFTTECEALSTLPYSMNFDNVTGTTSTSVSVNNLPMCWDYYNNGTNSSYTGYPIVYNSSSYAASGSNSVRFYAYSSNYGDQYAILPRVDETIYPLNTLALEFAARQLSTSYPFTIEVGVMTNPTDPTTFDLMSTFTFNSTTYETQECYFDAFTGTQGRIAIRARYTNTINYGYVDNIVIKEAPSCRKPLNVSVQSIGSNDVTISWGGDPSSSYNIAYGSTANFDPDMSSNLFSTSSTSYQISGLTSNTTYYVKVQTDCGGETSDWTDAIVFLTAANAADVPYQSDFSDATEVADWLLYNGSETNKWHFGTISASTTPVLFISNDNGISNAYTDTIASTVWACRDINFGNYAEHTLSVDWLANGESSYDYLYIYIGNPTPVTPGSTTAPAGATLLTGYLNQVSNYTTFTATFDGSYANTTKRLYFMWRNDTSIGNDPPASIQSVSLTGSDCGRPHSIHAENIGQTDADIAFSPALATDASWEYAYGTAGSNPNTLTPIALTDTLIQLYGLSSNTNYVVYVRTDCGGGDFSEWSTAFTFLTLCDVITIPYTENFDAYGTGETAYPNCWSKINTYSSERPYINATHYAGTGSMYFFAGAGTYNIAIAPEIDASYPVNTLQATFMYRGSYSTDKLIVGVMTNASDASTFVPVDTVYPGSSATAWVEKTVMFNNYTGSGAFIAFKNMYSSTSCYGYIDNLFIETIPTCQRPTSLVVTGTSSTDVTLSWTETGSASAWEIEYGTPGFTPGTGTTVSASSNPFTVTGLNEGTLYEFYVRAACSASDLSTWQGPVAAAPGSINMQTNGWDTLYTCNATIYDDGGVNGDYSNNCNSYVVVYPGTAGANVSVTGTLLAESSSWDYLIIYDGVGTSGTELYHSSQSSGTQVTVGPVQSTNGPLTIYFRSDGSNVYAGLALQVTCVGDTTGPGTTCDTPTALAASNITQTSANINWTAGGTENAWNLQYKAATATNWSNNISVSNTPTYALTGLTANTAYQVRVQANCGAGQTSNWATATFTTLATDQCPTPTNFRAESVTTNSATLAWDQQAGTANEWEINYKSNAAPTWTNITVSTNPYTITDLTPATTYQAQIIAHCVSGNNSDATELITFTTSADGVIDYVLDNNTLLYPNPTTGRLTIENGETIIENVAIYDVYGKLLMTTEVNSNVANIDASSYAAGIYFAKVQTENGVVTKRFVKK